MGPRAFSAFGKLLSKQKTAAELHFCLERATRFELATRTLAGRWKAIPRPAQTRYLPWSTPLFGAIESHAYSLKIRSIVDQMWTKMCERPPGRHASARARRPRRARRTKSYIPKLNVGRHLLSPSLSNQKVDESARCNSSTRSIELCTRYPSLASIPNSFRSSRRNQHPS
jgi:hypothetical protein